MHAFLKLLKEELQSLEFCVLICLIDLNHYMSSELLKMNKRWHSKYKQF
jgi:hypothetical protein